MFEAGERGIDESEAVNILKIHYRLENGDKTHEDIFRRIEPATGLLQVESGRYTFIHLTFQEFLTARYLVDHSEDSYFDTISPYVGNKRYEEVVKLFIGFLSMRNSGAANSIARRILEPEAPKVDEYLLAAESLLDIHKDNRQEKAVDLAMDRMQALIRRGEVPKILLRAGEALGRLGYTAGLEEFIPIPGGIYDLEGLGKKKIQTFEISRVPVTNFWYGQFMKAGGYETKEYWTKEGQKWLKKYNVTEPGYWRDRTYNCPTSPVVGVSWYEAAAFCNWLQTEKKDGFAYRLPTEEEWQAAAAGKEKRQYPWGNEIALQKCNYYETGLYRPSPVGIFLQGKTPEGVHDFGGNIGEWTRSSNHQKKAYEDFPYDSAMIELIMKEEYELFANKMVEKDRIIPTLRGGSFGDLSGYCRCALRLGCNPVVRNSTFGFRCARIKL
jgi:formylglycine-generating enzyme required for sulfatase activity